MIAQQNQNMRVSAQQYEAQIYDHLKNHQFEYAQSMINEMQQKTNKYFNLGGALIFFSKKRNFDFAVVNYIVRSNENGIFYDDSRILQIAILEGNYELAKLYFDVYTTNPSRPYNKTIYNEGEQRMSSRHRELYGMARNNGQQAIINLFLQYIPGELQ